MVGVTSRVRAPSDAQGAVAHARAARRAEAPQSGRRVRLRRFAPALFVAVTGCSLPTCGGEQLVDAPLDRDDVLALHDPPTVVVRAAGGPPDLSGAAGSSETAHLAPIAKALPLLAAGRGARYLTVERGGAVTYIGVHRGAARLPEVALLRREGGWQVIRRLRLRTGADHAVVADVPDDGAVRAAPHPKLAERLTELRRRTVQGEAAPRVAEAVVALGGDAVGLLTEYLSSARPDADRLITPIAALCTGDIDVAARIEPRERDEAFRGCFEAPGDLEVCGRGAWVRVTRGARTSTVPAAAPPALTQLSAPTDATAGALSLCGGPRRDARLARGVGALLAGHLELARVLRRHAPATLARAVAERSEDERRVARLLLGLPQDEGERARALTSPAMLPSLRALECISDSLEADDLVLWVRGRDSDRVWARALDSGVVDARLVAYHLLERGTGAAFADVDTYALARLWVDLSGSEADALSKIEVLQACADVPRWPRTRGGASVSGDRWGPRERLWQVRHDLLRRLVERPADPKVDAHLATSKDPLTRWLAVHARGGDADPGEVRRQAQAAVCRSPYRRKEPWWSPSLIDLVAERSGVEIDWEALTEAAPSACASAP